MILSSDMWRFFLHKISHTQWQIKQRVQLLVSYSSTPNKQWHHLLNGPLSRTTQASWYQKGKTNLDFTEAWEWVAVASAGPYKSAPCPRQIPVSAPPSLSFFTGRMPFLPPNQQCQSTEGTKPNKQTNATNKTAKKTFSCKKELQLLNLIASPYERRTRCVVETACFL